MLLSTASRSERETMRSFTAVVEQDVENGMYLAYIPGFQGAHTQGETLDELRANLREVGVARGR